MEDLQEQIVIVIKFILFFMKLIYLRRFIFLLP